MFSRIFFLYCFSLAQSAELRAQKTNCISLIEAILENSKQITKEEKEGLVNCIYIIQNSGFMYDEKECKYDSAKAQIEIALKLWKYLKDTLNQANLLKYLGYLNGRLGQYRLAKSQIQEAIKLYEVRNANFGIAVSLFNLSRVYEYQNIIDSAIYYTTQAKIFWTTKKDTSRLILLNNNLIHLAAKTNFPRNYEPLINENNVLLSNARTYWLQELDFYYVTFEFYKNLNNKKQNIFEKLYNEKIAILEKTDQIKKYSVYDEKNCR